MNGTMQANRRSFMLAAGVSAVGATKVLGANDSIRVGAIGCGGRMRSLLDAADTAGGYELVSVCDVYEPRRDEARARVKNGSVSSHIDYRELLDRKDVDAVIIASPNHWHVPMASDALAAGKHVYLEKPITQTLAENEIITRNVHAANRVFQCGMQQRSWIHFQSAVDLIQGGSLGRITQVRTYWFQNYQSVRPPQPVIIDLLDWKRWLGTAPQQPFSAERFHNWRWYWDFGGGAMTDLFTHWIDVVQWATNAPEPHLVTAMGDKYVFDQWDCPDTVLASLRYPGFEVVYEGTMVSSVDDGGIEFRGTKATLKLDRSGFGIYRERLKANPVLSERSEIDGTISHMENFFDCIRTSKTPNAPVEAGVSCARAGEIANVALRTGNKVTWPQKT